MTTAANYRLGAAYALATAFLLAVQEPFSALAARRLTSTAFVGFTQVALLLSIPLLVASASSRRTFAAVLGDPGNWPKLAALLGAGIAGLALYDIGLGGAHPIITAGILNLSPFWAALVAFAISRKSIPGSPGLFFGCFAIAFCGAMMIAWSQLTNANGKLLGEILESVLHSHWIYALPMPIFFALSGTLVGKWFAGLDESGVIAANFLVSALTIIPAAGAISYFNQTFALPKEALLPVLLLLVGTMASSAAGRVVYQIALTKTDNDNGFVTMFFLAIPVLSTLISIPLSHWIEDLRIAEGPLFFVGMILVSAPLLLFSVRTWRGFESGGACGDR